MAVKAFIAEKHAEWSTFMKEGNTTDLATSHFAEDCKIMPPGFQTMNGRDALQKYAEYIIASGCTGGSVTTDEIDPVAESAPVGTIFWERGHYVYYKACDAIMETGKYVALWRKLPGGKLEIYADIWNSTNSCSIIDPMAQVASKKVRGSIKMTD
ncbi:uncharacterized protein [Amphiura filiformis]|uniref:uncharacterized protein n=1 Tax=Amphiura filiformis TaxID=82378 RepID=UPI003B213AD4